jgi:tRNA pseudouridine55 synthase
LPVCLGKATKLAGFLTAEKKQYMAEVVLGITTDTLDTTGKILSKKNVLFNEDAIRAAVAGFIGEQEQLPPMYSAVKVNGKKLYESAREGKTVERVPRKIQIENIEIIQINSSANTFTMQVDCSKGTYIRSLCADIGAALGCGACMGVLTRTRTGAFTIGDAVTLSVFRENPAPHIIPVEQAFPYPRAYVQPAEEKKIMNGNPIKVNGVAFTQKGAERYWFYFGEELIALYKYEQNRFVPEVMLI